MVALVLLRADEQEKITVNSTIVQSGVNITRELDTDFYLGVYGGDVVVVVVYSAPHVVYDLRLCNFVAPLQV